MELRQLKYAVALADTLHFGRAAESQFITQSALSQQISRLERELGTPLFERSSHFVRVTPAGEMFISKARQILQDSEAVKAEVKRLAKGLVGHLRIGQFAEGAGELTPWIIRSFRDAYPQVELSMMELPMDNQVDLIESGQVDVAFVRAPFGDDRVVLARLFEEPRVVVLPSDHQLAEASTLSVAEILDEPFISGPESTPAQWRSFWSCDQERGEAPRKLLGTMNSVSEGLAAVAYLGGIDTIPTSASRIYAFPGVTYVPLTDAALSVSAVARRRNNDSPLVRAFQEVAREVCRSHIHLVPQAVLPDGDAGPEDD